MINAYSDKVMRVGTGYSTRRKILSELDFLKC